jgi:HTH-type transcriptional regulator/antitoxin HigA
VDARPFSRSNLTRLIEQLRLLMESPEEVRHAPRILADFGIKLLLIEHLAHTKIDGATFWLNGSPVIVLSLRYDRIDSFWHTLMHEVAHVWYADGVDEDRPMLDTEIVADKSPLSIIKPDYEARADEFATNAIIPTNEMEDFIRRVRPLYSAVRVQGFAKRMKVHAGLVVGQLQHRGEISYANLRRMLTPVRRFATASGLTDGWGQALPIAV